MFSLLDPVIKLLIVLTPEKQRLRRQEPCLQNTLLCSFSGFVAYIAIASGLSLVKQGQEGYFCLLVGSWGAGACIDTEPGVGQTTRVLHIVGYMICSSAAHRPLGAPTSTVRT